MIMRKIYFSILTLILMMASGSAMAQNPKLSELTVVNNDNPYVLTLNFKEGKEYEGIAVSAALDGVYDALGTTAADFDFAADAAAGKVYTQTATVTVAENIVTAIELNDELNDPAAASGGAWFGRSVINPSDEEKPVMSVPMSWGSKAQVAGEGDTKTDLLLCTFFLQNISLTEGTLTIGSTGQYPGVLKAGDADYTYLYIANGTKAVKVKVQANVAALPDVKFNSSLSAHTTMMTGKQVDIHVVNGRDAVASVDVSDLITMLPTLGISVEDLNDVIAKMVVAEKADNSEGDASDVLMQVSEMGYLPFSYYADNSRCFVVNDAVPNVEYDALEVWEPYIDEEAKTFNITVDLAAQQMTVGQTHTIYLYIVYDTYAMPITINVTADAPATLDQMEKAGEQKLTIEAEPSDYLIKTVEYDLADVLEKLGAENAADLESWVLDSNEALAKPQNADNSIHYWQNEQGQICGWGSSAVAMFYPGDEEYTTLPSGEMIEKGIFRTCQMAGRYNDLNPGESAGPFTLRFFFVYGTKYYEIDLDYTFTMPKQSEEFKLEEKGKGTYLQQFVASKEAMPYEETWTLDTELIASKIGTTDFTVYADKYVPGEVEGEGKLEVKKDWNCTPYPGFWYGIKEYADVEGTNVVDASGWTAAGDNAFGYTLADGVIKFYIFARPAGETYHANIYLVNKETGDYFRYKFTAQYVESVIPSNVVGEYEDTQVYTEDPISLDMKAVYDMLEIEDGDLEVLWASSQTTYIDNISFQGMLDADGYVFDTDSGQDLPADGVTATYDEVDNTITIELNDENRYTEAESTDQNIIRLAFDYTTGDGDQAVTKRVIYTLTIVSEYTATGINSVKAEKATAKKAYNLAGQQVDKGYKGIVIEGGRKVLRK